AFNKKHLYSLYQLNYLRQTSLMNIKITGTGSYIPDIVEKNEDFQNHEFFNTDGSTINHSNDVIIEKFKAITGIKERRYVKAHLNSSDIAFFAAERAIVDSKINPEELDYIIVAHNYGDIKHGSSQSDTVPSIASRVKHLLGIKTQNVLLTIFYLVAQVGWRPLYR